MSVDATESFNNADNQLPIYRWFPDMPTKPEVREITAESFLPQRNKNEAQERAEENGRAKLLARRAKKAAKLAMESIVKSNTNPKTLADIYSIKPEVIPSMEQLDGADEAVADNGETLSEAIEVEAVEPRAIRFGRLAVLALQHRASKLRSSAQAHKPSVSVNEEALLKPWYATGKAAQAGYEKLKDLAQDEENRRKLKKATILAVGGLAIAGAGAYFYQKGVPGLGHGAHAGQELSHNSAPQQHLAAFPEFKIPLHAVAVGAQVSHHAHRAASAVRKTGIHIEHIKYAGDTVWFHAQSRLQAVLGHKPSDNQLNAYVSRTLKLNHLNWQTAKEVVRGQAIKLPIIHQ